MTKQRNTFYYTVFPERVDAPEISGSRKGLTMETADLILKSNVIYTGRGEKPVSGGVAIRGNRIADVAAEKDIEKYRSADTKVYEYNDKLIMPGIIDAHDHLWWGAVADSRYMVDITGSGSEEEAVKMIRKYACENPQANRIRGFGWFPANWNGAPLPSKRTLDKAVPDRPAYMMCADAHTCWMNSLALEESGYAADMELAGGSVGVDENGDMNGLVFEPDALVYAWSRLYDFPESEMKEIVRNLMKGLASCGITAVSDMSADDYLEYFHKRYKLFQQMENEGEITSRIHIFTRLMGLTDFSAAKALSREFCSEKLQVTGLKGFLDGVTSTYTGLLLEPYTDRPDTAGEGVPLASKEALEASVIAGNAAGLPVRIHCIAEGSVRMALDAYEASLKVNGRHGLKNTVEHIETIHPDDIPRFTELDVIPSMQPEHLSMDADEKLTRMGKERCRWEWPHRSLLDAGAMLAFGTDFPVVPYDPFPNIYSALARKNFDGTNARAENGEYITVAEALSAYTLGSAMAYGRENELGTLEKGKLADVAVIDRDLFTAAPEEIKNASVILTVMDGKVIFEKQ